MEKSPSWEANRFSASQEIPHILWNPQIHYRVYMSPQLSLSWAQMSTYEKQIRLND